MGNSSISLYPILKEGYWVTFDSQGGSVIARQFVDRNVPADQRKVSDPGTMVKTGYTFSGWYTDEECTTLYDFSTEVTSPMTLYAGWKPDTETKYTVRYWIEYQSDPGTDGTDDVWDYKFVAAQVKNGTTGSLAEYDENFIFTAPYNLDIYGYELNTEKTTATTIAGDGNTIYNVYYQCKTFDLSFRVDGFHKAGSTETYLLSYKGLKYSTDLKFVWDRMTADGAVQYMNDNKLHFYSTEGSNTQLSMSYEEYPKVESKNRYRHRKQRPGSASGI